jgi:hypothetical protein
VKKTAAIIKCRRLLGSLAGHGIEASRATQSDREREGPDVLLVADDGRAWLVALWAGTTVQPSLLANPSDAAPSLDAVVTALMDWRNARRTPDEAAPELMVIAPALAADEVPSGFWRVGRGTVPLIGRRDCSKEETLANAILSKISPVLPPEIVARWRVAAVPEVRVDSPWKRRRVVRETTALAAPLLLDYKQERCARLDLEADEEKRALARDLNVRVVTGVAGCGKTLVLVHRAALLASHFPNARVLLISFNRPLIADLRRRLARHQLGTRIECITFNQWLRNVAPPRGEMMHPKEVIRWIERERQRAAYPALEKMSAEWVKEEMGWMCDHALAGEAYLIAERKGRGTGLSVNQRREMLRLLTRYRAYLRHEKRADWSEWPLSVLQQRSPAVAQQMFDHLLIDEAQFFGPVWLDLLRHALKPGGHLFLCADPTQGFLRRRMSWSSLGLDVRRRSHRLEKPYRSTRAILEFARNFYLRRLPDDDEPLNLPAPEWLETLDPGTPPILQPAGPGQDQLKRLENELRLLKREHVPPGDVLILVAGRTLSAEAIVEHLCAKLGPDAAALLKNDSIVAESAGVAHLMAATGLERPIVFLLGVDDLAAEESDPTLGVEEQTGKWHDHTRQIYVGLTRAMERLVIYAGHARLREALGAIPLSAERTA